MREPRFLAASVEDLLRTSVAVSGFRPEVLASVSSFPDDGTGTHDMATLGEWLKQYFDR